MTDVVIGAVLLTVGAGLVFVGLPNKNLESPRRPISDGLSQIAY